jgi:glutamate 5-kinase
MIPKINGKPLLVLKVGTASLTDENGRLNEVVMVELARQVAQIHLEYNIILVSSGAVGAGKKYLKNYTGSMMERKAAASIGNPLLLNKYALFFAPYGIVIAQSLCERHHFSDRKKFLQLKETFTELWANDVIPIANENDVVSDLELKFSDNDELATLIAVGFSASVLLFGTNVPGVYDQNNEVISRIESIDESILSLARKNKSSLGLGGMVSKLTFARLATKMGIKVVIFRAGTPGELLRALQEETGTVFIPQQASSLPERRKWLASGSLVSGSVQIDKGASEALKNRKSLLVVGVKSIIQEFDKGEIFEILDENHVALAVAKANYSSKKVAENLGAQNFIVAHADDIVLL